MGMKPGIGITGSPMLVGGASVWSFLCARCGLRWSYICASSCSWFRFFSLNLCHMVLRPQFRRARTTIVVALGKSVMAEYVMNTQF